MTTIFSIEMIYGNDSINGEIDHDVIFGGSGNDVLRGQIGSAVLDGGAGKDIMNGGLV